MKRVLLACLFILGYTTSAAATTWYVHQAGSHGSTCSNYQTISTPAATIGAAMTCAISAGGAGNTVEITDTAATVYSETITSWPSAVAGNRFTLKATNAGVVTIRAPGDNKIIDGSSSHIQIGPNLILDGVNQTSYAQGRAIMWQNSDDVVITGNEIKNASAHCVYTGGITNLIFRGNTVHDCGTPQGSPPDFTNQTHGLYCEDNGALIENNTIYNTNNFGMQCYSEFATANNNIIRNNRISNYGTDPVSNGAGILFQDSGARVYNNVIFNGDGGAIAFWHATTNARVVNNTIYNVTGAGITGNTGSTGSVVRNNAITNAAGGAIVTMEAGATVASNDTASVATNIWNNPAGGDFTVKTGSSLINTGTSAATDMGCVAGSTCTDIIAVIRPQGGSWDIGAYEFSAPGTPPIVTINQPAGCTGTSAACTITTNAVNLNGSTTQSGGTLTWVNDRGGSGTATGSWAIAGIVLKSGINNITVTGTDGVGNAGADTIAITYAPTFPGAALVGAWGFEDGTGTTATDSSGLVNTATLVNGPTWVTTGRFGKALSFNGINQFLRVTDTNSLRLTQSFTISAWVQPSTSLTTFKAVLYKDGGSLQSPYQLYGVINTFGGCTAGGYAGYVTVNGASGPQYSACSSLPLQIGVWVHIAITYDNATGDFKLYRQGILVLTISSATGYMEPSTIGSPLDLRIGGSEFGENWQGLIDEVRLYNVALPITAASNTVAGAACTQTNFTDNTAVATASIVGNMNCPIINLTPPSQFKLSAGATELKLGTSATSAKVGANP